MYLFNIFVDPHFGSFLQLPSLPRGGTLRDHLSARGWLQENHSSGIEERMREGHLEEYIEERSFGIEAVSELQEKFCWKGGLVQGGVLARGVRYFGRRFVGLRGEAR